MSSRQRFNQLQTKEHMNYGEVLFENEMNMTRLLDVFHDPEFRGFKAFIDWFIHAIPDDWKDVQYKVELAQAVTEISYDVRPKICGFKITKELCERLAIPVYEVEKSNDPNLQHQAVINLLYRRGVIGKIKWLELSTGRKIDPNKPDTFEITDEQVLGDIQPE